MEQPPEYSPRGVDVPLIRWFLEMSPADRLQTAQHASMTSSENAHSTQTVDFCAILRALSRQEVDFIIAGLASAVLNGAPVSTWDLDIVPSSDRHNLDRLQAALASIEAEFRFITPALQRHYTRFGPVQVLGAIGNNLAYHDLVPHTTVLEVAENLHARVLNLDKLIEIKEFLDTEEDRAVLPTLRRTLIERTRL
jgi:hypothetical protein